VKANKSKQWKNEQGDFVSDTWVLPATGFKRTVWDTSPLYRRLSDHFVENGGNREIIPKEANAAVRIAILLAAQKGVSQREAQAVFQKIHSDLLVEENREGKLNKTKLKQRVAKSLKLWQKHSSDKQFCTLPKLAEIMNLVKRRKNRG